MSDETGVVSAWTTRDEVAFIQRIGIFTAMDKKTLLSGYLEGVKQRVEWDGISKSTVIRIARAEMRAAL
jgi:hypothetical protein